jgi:REP element-mobilizing transposase RayT
MRLSQNDKPKKDRHSIRLEHYDYSRNGYYYITLCTHDKKYLFGKIINEKMQRNQLGNIVHDYWKKLETEKIKPLNKIVMPNHFHGIFQILSGLETNREITDTNKLIQRRQMLLPKIIGKFKMITAKEINKILNRPGKPVWQRNYHEHIIRDDEEYYNIIEYIEKNPEWWRKDKYS